MCIKNIDQANTVKKEPDHIKEELIQAQQYQFNR